MSSWLITVMTFERYLSVRFPLHIKSWSTARVARIVIVIMTAFFTLFDGHYFFTYHLIHTGRYAYCYPVSDGAAYFIQFIWPWMDATLYSFIPFLVLLIFNMLLLKTLAETRNKLSSSRHTAEQGSGQQSRNLSVMLLTISFIFLLATTPSVIYWVFYAYWDTASPVTLLGATFTDTLMYINHSANFYLYCITGRKFRTELQLMFCSRTLAKSSASDLSLKTESSSDSRSL